MMINTSGNLSENHTTRKRSFSIHLSDRFEHFSHQLILHGDCAHDDPLLRLRLLVRIITASGDREAWFITNQQW